MRIGDRVPATPALTRTVHQVSGWGGCVRPTRRSARQRARAGRPRLSSPHWARTPPTTPCSVPAASHWPRCASEPTRRRARASAEAAETAAEAAEAAVEAEAAAVTAARGRRALCAECGALERVVTALQVLCCARRHRGAAWVRWDRPARARPCNPVHPGRTPYALLCIAGGARRGGGAGARPPRTRLALLRSRCRRRRAQAAGGRTCAPHVHCMCTATRVRRMCTACAPHVRRLSAACAPHVHYGRQPGLPRTADGANPVCPGCNPTVTRLQPYVARRRTSAGWSPRSARCARTRLAAAHSCRGMHAQ